MAHNYRYITFINIIYTMLIVALYTNANCYIIDVCNCYDYHNSCHWSNSTICIYVKIEEFLLYFKLHI